VFSKSTNEFRTQSALKLNFACSQKHPIFGCCARLRQPDRFYAARSEIFPIGDREPTGYPTGTTV
jgi:hypothetical protein